MTSAQIIRLLDNAAKDVFGDCETAGVPVADGGEGTVEAIVSAEDGELIKARATDPLGHEIDASYGVIGERKAVIETAASSGLALVPNDLRNPLNTTSYGTGELILDALNRGYRDLSIALGGSATNDGGMGCARALGIKFFSEDGLELEGYGRDLIKVNRIDMSGLDSRVKDASISVMCDVTNPLCGDRGATYTFGPQKGATPKIADELETGMCHYRDVIREALGIDCDALKGAGAAGGLGAALKVFLDGDLRSGIETVLDLIHFDERLAGVDLVVTGEGRADWQSCYGKVMQGVGEHSRRFDVPVVALCGSLGPGAMDICKYGVVSLMTAVNAPMDISDALNRAEELYYEAAIRMFRFVKLGMTLHDIEQC